ncbi:MAG: flippase-like domain-containing protein [Candidatus Altiarchaeota archaeon]
MRRHRFIVLFFFGVLIVMSLVLWVGFWEVLRDLAFMNLKYFMILLCIQFVMMFLWAVKWSIVLRHSKASFRKILPVSFVGYLINNLTPISMAGGEPIRAYLLSRVDDISTEDSAASVIVDLFLEVFPLLGLVLLGIGLSFMYNVSVGVALLLGVAGLFILFVSAVIMTLFVNERISLRMIEVTLGLIERIPVGFLRDHAKDAKTRIDDIIGNFMSSMRKTMMDWRIITVGVLVSTLNQMLWIFRMYIIFNMMMGLNLPWDVVLIGRITVAAASFASIIPGGLGIWEGVGTWVYSMFGVAASSAMAANLVERLFSYWIGSAIGLAAAAYLGVTEYIKRYLD